MHYIFVDKWSIGGYKTDNVLRYGIDPSCQNTITVWAIMDNIYKVVADILCSCMEG